MNIHSDCVSDVAKTFIMHMRGGVELPWSPMSRFLAEGRACAVLGGPSGVGKSSILKMLYGNYGTESGQILVCTMASMSIIASADPRTVLAIRRDTIGYVSQFLRVVPRVSALDVAAEPLVRGRRPEEAMKGAALFSPGSTCRKRSGRCRRRLFGRRTAARQHRARFHHRPSGPAARRADGVARCRQPRGGDRA
jgi:ABC-type glutathione transport system ATPase component